MIRCRSARLPVQLRPATYRHADLTRQIIGAFSDVYNALGSGFREVVYERAVALAERALTAKQQVPVAVWYHGYRVGVFRADLIVEGKVLLELKALPALEPAHLAQVINALRATRLDLGLLMNFGAKPQFRRLVATDPALLTDRSA